MPTYAYACTECDHRFETQQAFTDNTLTECPACTGRLRKLFNAVGIVFKGSGFYRTDSRTSGSTSSPKSSSSGSGSSSDSSSAPRRAPVPGLLVGLVLRLLVRFRRFVEFLLGSGHRRGGGQELRRLTTVRPQGGFSSTHPQGGSVEIHR